MIKSRKDAPYGFDFAVKTAFFGRSDRVRTCGIDVPNVARYQLRHTPVELLENYVNSIPNYLSKVNSFFFIHAKEERFWGKRSDHTGTPPLFRGGTALSEIHPVLSKGKLHSRCRNRRIFLFLLFLVDETRKVGHGERF